jgi:hypothetical protein
MVFALMDDWQGVWGCYFGGGVLINWLRVPVSYCNCQTDALYRTNATHFQLNAASQQILVTMTIHTHEENTDFLGTPSILEIITVLGLYAP